MDNQCDYYHCPSYVIGVLGFWFWHNTTSYVTTDNAKLMEIK